jgi:serine protease DegQ
MRYLLVAGALALAVPPVGADDTPKKDPPKTPLTYEVPYRLTDTKHVLVRVKLNGKGPFNFIIDTGAPALILTEAAAKKAGGKADGNWTTFDKMEIEGGVTIDKPRGLAIDPFQLKGMNAMGLAGVELHGMMGYHILARYKIEYDFTDTKLKWTPVDFKVPDPKRVEVDKEGGQGGLEMIGTLMQMMSALGGVKPNFDVKPRGFLGAELEAQKDELVVKSIVAGGPADKAGIKTGDRIETAKGKSLKKPEDLLEAVKKLPEGSSLKLGVKRGEDTKDITVELGKGL